MRLFVVAALGLVALANGQTVYDEYDAVVIEAAEDASLAAETHKRFARQALDLNIDPLLQQNFGFQPKGQACFTGDQRLGRCTAHKECYKYFRIFDIKESESWIYGSYDACGVTTTRGIQLSGVCCPAVKKAPLPVVEEPAFPIEFAQLSSKCGRKNNCNQLLKIVAGETACKNELPFMAAMLNKNRHFCGGSIIDKRHILTAAHCVAHMSKYDVQNLNVNLGDHRLDTKSETHHQSYKVKRVIRHKGFDQKTLHSDVAILTLDKDIPTFDSSIYPICMPTNLNKDYFNEEVEVAGWGTLGEGKSQSKELRKVDVKVWGNDRCKNSYGNQAPGGIIESMVCANHDNPLRDSCSGDSGGPLYKCKGGHCEQLGIVSWGIGCAKREYPGVYTRITSLLPWITKIVAKY